MSKDLTGSRTYLYVRGHMVENAAKTMESDMVNYLKRQCDLMVKWTGVGVFRSHLGLYSSLGCIVLVFVGCESSGSRKAYRWSQKA